MNSCSMMSKGHKMGTNHKMSHPLAACIQLTECFQQGLAICDFLPFLVSLLHCFVDAGLAHRGFISSTNLSTLCRIASRIWNHLETQTVLKCSRHNKLSASRCFWPTLGLGLVIIANDRLLQNCKLLTIAHATGAKSFPFALASPSISILPGLWRW